VWEPIKSFFVLFFFCFAVAPGTAGSWIMSGPVSTAGAGVFLGTEVLEGCFSCHAGGYPRSECANLLMQIHEKDLTFPAAKFLDGGGVVVL